jgi:hypothetical protein
MSGFAAYSVKSSKKKLHLLFGAGVDKSGRRSLAIPNHGLSVAWKRPAYNSREELVPVLEHPARLLAVLLTETLRGQALCVKGPVIGLQVPGLDVSHICLKGGKLSRRKATV